MLLSMNQNSSAQHRWYEWSVVPQNGRIIAWVRHNAAKMASEFSWAGRRKAGGEC